MFVTTKASALRNNSVDSYTSVTFKSNKKKAVLPKSNQGKISKSDGENKNNANKPEDMKKLRYEIIKFGTSGFTGTLKEDANVALMVSLGAEPPKKKEKNYKELLKEKKMEAKKSEFDNRKYSSLSLKKNKTMSSGKYRKNGKKDVKGLLNVYGEVNKKRISKKKKK